MADDFEFPRRRGRKARRSPALEKLAQDLSDHLLQQSKQALNQPSPQQRKAEWECDCGCMNFLDRTCCRKCRAGRPARQLRDLSRVAASDRQASGAAGGARSGRPQQGQTRAGQPPAPHLAAAKVTDSSPAGSGESKSSWELALEVVATLGASDELVAAVLREWESADPTNARFTKPQGAAMLQAKALRARLSDARWCVKIAERAGLAEAAVTALRSDVQALEAEVEASRPPRTKLLQACSKAKASLCQHYQAAARLTKLQAELAALDAQRANLIHSVDHAVAEESGAFKAAMEAMLDKARAVVAALQDETPASTNLGRFKEAEASTLEAIEFGVMVLEDMENGDCDPKVFPALAEQVEKGHQAWALLQPCLGQSEPASSLALDFASWVAVAKASRGKQEPAQACAAADAHFSIPSETKTVPTAETASLTPKVPYPRGRSSSPCHVRQQSRSRSAPARAGQECGQVGLEAAAEAVYWKAALSTTAAKRGGSVLSTPVGKVPKAVCRQAERCQQSAHIRDNEGYDDSLYDSSEDDRARDLPVRKSKLTKAEQKQFALWKQQVDAAIDAEEPSHSGFFGTSAGEPRVGGEDWE